MVSEEFHRKMSETVNINPYYWHSIVKHYVDSRENEKFRGESCILDVISGLPKINVNITERLKGSSDIKGIIEDIATLRLYCMLLQESCMVSDSVIEKAIQVKLDNLTRG